MKKTVKFLTITLLLLLSLTAIKHAVAYFQKGQKEMEAEHDELTNQFIEEE